MDEQEKNKGENKGTSETDTAGAENTTEEIPEVKKAREAATELKAENDRREKLLEEERKQEARKALSGGTYGNIEQKPKEEMSDKEYKDYFLKHGKPPEE